MKKYLLIILPAVFLSACGNETNSQKNVKNNLAGSKKENYNLIGRRGLITYPEMTAEVEYLSDTTLYWKTTDHAGKVAEEKETISYSRLNNYLHFLSWIEQDGLTVSQVINTQNKTVSTFISYKNENSKRGKRSGIFSKGSFKFKE